MPGVNSIGENIHARCEFNRQGDMLGVSSIGEDTC